MESLWVVFKVQLSVRQAIWKLRLNPALQQIWPRLSAGLPLAISAANDFTSAIRALQQVSDTKILSTPQILVTNNEEAKIHIGDTVPYIVATTNGTGTMPSPLMMCVLLMSV